MWWDSNWCLGTTPKIHLMVTVTECVLRFCDTQMSSNDVNNVEQPVMTSQSMVHPAQQVGHLQHIKFPGIYLCRLLILVHLVHNKIMSLSPLLLLHTKWVLCPVFTFRGHVQSCSWPECITNLITLPFHL